jgi:hypothetical protein
MTWKKRHEHELIHEDERHEHELIHEDERHEHEPMQSHDLIKFQLIHEDERHEHEPMQSHDLIKFQLIVINLLGLMVDSRRLIEQRIKSIDNMR